jgi:orotidine-5'-phosphate decarboxylase
VSVRDRLIVALDHGTPEEIRALVQRLGPAVSFYKIGWPTLLKCGSDLVKELRDAGKHIFLDLKFFDVPNTMREAVSAVAALGARFVTVHGNHDIISGALEGRKGTDLKVLAVTVLTSLSEQDVRRMYSLPDTVTLEDHVVRIARGLVASGCDGVIASAQEVARIRGEVDAGAILTVPGIRREGESRHDHQRSGTPYDAIRAGADFLVVGRPIYTHPEPTQEAEAYVREIERGLADRAR